MYKFLITLSCITFCILQTVYSQNRITKLKANVAPPVCYASGKVEKSYTPPPPNALLKSAAEKADIVVNYSLFPENAKAAFEFAINIWENIIQSDIPIYMQADWRTMDNSVLGSAGPTSYYTNFKHIPHKNRYYPVALAERITKEEITGSFSPDISSVFNKEIAWYFGTDGETPDSLYDFVTIALHEIAHGLGFTGFFYIDDNQGSYAYNEAGDAAAFDLLVIDEQNNQLVDTTLFSIPSTELKDAFTSGSLYANSPSAIHRNNGSKPRLYTPQTFDEGSSIYHLNEATHPHDLMTHAIGKAEAVHDPGKLVSGIISDLGWKHMFIDFAPLRDIEQVHPLEFNVSIESDYKIESDSLFIIYSTDNFANHRDSLKLLAVESSNTYSAEFIPDFETGELHYYISAMDTSQRIFKRPTEAPQHLYSIKIGPDTELPVIIHNEIPYFWLPDINLKISAIIYDNIAIDTVFAEYKINEELQPSFALAKDSANSYSGFFNFDINQLNDGDLISYHIIAIDSSLSPNSKKIPEDTEFEFKIENVLTAVNRYSNNFDLTTTDFVISDFDIYTETNFDNAALHSAHPYASTEETNTNYNFTTILKKPIILNAGARMNFDEVVLVEPGEALSDYGDDDFWDYVIIEGSVDTGKTWLPFADGYDSGEYNIWKNNYMQDITDQNSNTLGTKEWYVYREIDLLSNGNFNTGDTTLIRFRLFSDPYANGWGWTIDNLKIQIPVSALLSTLSPGNIQIYPNPFSNEIQVSLQLSNEVKLIELKVYNPYGSLVYSSSIKNVLGAISQTINLKGNAAGIYFVAIKENGKTVATSKVIKR